MSVLTMETKWRCLRDLFYPGWSHTEQLWIILYNKFTLDWALLFLVIKSQSEICVDVKNISEYPRTCIPLVTHRMQVNLKNGSLFERSQPKQLILFNKSCPRASRPGCSDFWGSVKRNMAWRHCSCWVCPTDRSTEVDVKSWEYMWEQSRHSSCSTSTNLCRMWAVTRWLKMQQLVYRGLILLCAVFAQLEEFLSIYVGYIDLKI